MFEKSLVDVIKGVRNTSDEGKYISGCLDECRKELRQADLDIKANAVAKLYYFQMLGYDISWAAFQIVEVMSSRKFTHKRIGYLAACQSFHQDTDVLMLTTNMLKKDLTSHNVYEAGLAINGLACFVTQDLARDLANDIVTMMSSTKSYLRKKATLATYKIFLNFPDALRPTFPRLKDKLDDDDPSVQCAAVSVICELARKNPKNYLSLAPKFFELLTTSQNNWLRIKIIKLFAALTPYEPRLAKKLASPLTDLIHSTPAMSLLYECIMTMLKGMPDHNPSVQLCVQKLRIFIEDNDQNLKYLGLQALARVLEISPKFVTPHSELILDCLNDADESIRLRALDLISGLANKKNIVDLVKKLVIHLEEADGITYRDEVLSKIISICSQNRYALIPDFAWYIQVLVRLTQLEDTRLGHLLASQLQDVTIRVKTIQEFSVEQMVSLLGDSRLFTNTAEGGVIETLYAAAYIVGEFGKFIRNYSVAMDGLLHSRTTSLPAHIQAMYITAALKVLVSAASKVVAGDESLTRDDLVNLRTTLRQGMEKFVVSGHLEVQERAVMTRELADVITRKLDEEDVYPDLIQLFEEELKPVAPKAQKKVPVPEGLNLDKWIHTPPPSDDEIEDDDGDLFSASSFQTTPFEDDYPTYKKKSNEPEDYTEARAARLAARNSNPNYLGSYNSGSSSGLTSPGPQPQGFDVDDIPVQQIDLGANITVSTSASGLAANFPVSSVEYKKKKKKKLSKKEKKRLKKKGLPIPDDEDDEDDTPQQPAVEIVDDEELPEGAHVSDGDDDKPDDDPHRLLDMDLEAPVRADEYIPQPSHRESTGLSAEDAAKLEKEKRKEERRRRKEKDKKKKKKKKSKDAESDVSTSHVIEEEDEPPAPVDTQNSVLDAWLEDEPEQPSAEKPKKKKKKKSKGKSSSSPSATPNNSPLKPLDQDDHIGVAFDTQAEEDGSVTIVLAIANKTAEPIRGVKLVSASSSMKLQLEDGADGVVLDHEIDSGAHSQLPCRLQVAFKPSSKRKFKASLHYESSGTSYTLDIKVPITPSAFVAPGPISEGDFTELLASGSLQGPVSSGLISTPADLPSSVLVVVNKLHLQCVESVADSASLYGRIAPDIHICMLLKAQDGGFVVDAKSTNVEAVEALLKEIAPLFS